MAAVDIDRVRRFVGKDNGLVVVSTTRADGSIQSSVVNGGVLDHPVTGAPVVGLVVQGGAASPLRLGDRKSVV